jgi:hypothetical protein
MVKFIEVDPDSVDGLNVREAHRGRVSYPILKAFLETGMKVGQIDRTGIQQSLVSLSSSLGAYIRNHELPLKLFQRGGEIFLARLDIDNAGNVNKENNKISNIKRGNRDAIDLADDDDVEDIEDDELDEEDNEAE